MSRKHWVVRVDTVRLVNIGSSGRTGDTRPGQTTNKPKDLSVCDKYVIVRSVDVGRVARVCMMCTYVSESQ
jgi:hypothetical protein